MGDKDNTTKAKAIPPYMRFVLGGSSGMLSICVVQPMDLIKTRMQLMGPAGKNMTILTAILNIGILSLIATTVIRKNGVLGLYAGISAALFRQATYTTSRLGCFNYITDVYTAAYGTPNFGAKLLTGITAGAVGALVGNPAEVALIRMTADGRLPPEQRRNYTNVFNALGRMVREEGVGTLMRGVSATVSRAAVVNGAQLSTYAQAREMLLPRLGDGIFLHFCSSMISGFVTTAASQPLDMIKTRVQNAAKGGAQVGLVGTLVDVVKKEGVFGLWNGFLPTYFKIGPHTVFTFIFLEQLTALYLSVA